MNNAELKYQENSSQKPDPQKYGGQDADLSWLENPEVFQVNRIKAHSDHFYYEKAEDIRHTDSIMELYDIPLRQSLNGEWRFSYAENPFAAVPGFYKEGFDCSGFDFIRVPGHIQTQGYGKCQYTNAAYPWDARYEIKPPEIPWEENGVGQYITYFRIKEAWKGKRIFLSFQGVETAFYFWLNGRFSGYAEDSFTPSEFEITELLKAGENKLAVEVYERSSASWTEDQDFWRFSGIFRDVYLYAIPDIHVQDLHIRTDLENQYTLGKIRIEAELTGAPCKKAEVLLLDADQKEVLFLEEYEPADPQQQLFILEGNVPKVRQWSAEDPYLYTLYLKLYGEEQRLVELVVYQAGFRRFELKDGVMCLNGKRILFKGINRHEFAPQKGRAIGLEEMLFDVEFMKKNNINAVRTSHYPNHSQWCRLCDRYGLYVIDETNLESHGTWQKMGICEPSGNIPGDDLKWLDMTLDRAGSMYERDKNHPSVLIWSCGNESYAGTVLEKVSDFFHEKDPGRLVHYEGVVWNRAYDGCTDMESRMYPKAKDIEAYLKNSPQKPYISCEYLHAMGNSCGGMHCYTLLEEKYEKYQGGFIWDYIDQALYRTDSRGEKRLAYGGDFDDRPTDYCFCTNGIVYADRTSSPKVQEVKHLYANVKLFPDEKGVRVVNGNLFLSTGSYLFRYWVEKEGVKIFESSCSIAAAPGQEFYAELNYPQWEEAGEYSYQVSMCLREDTLWAERGHELSFGQTVLIKGESVLEPAVSDSLHIAEGDAGIGVFGKEFGVMFSKSSCGLDSLVFHGREFMTQVLKPSFWRAMTDNDRGCGLGFHSGIWQQAGMFQRCGLPKIERKEEGTRITYSYETAGIPDLQHEISYFVKPDRTLYVTMKYPGKEGLPDIPAYALDFRLKRQYRFVRYYGYGPEENYSDRCCGARLGIFETTPEENLSRYLVPQECGNRTGVRFLEITDEMGLGLRFSCCGRPFDCSVLPYSAYELELATHREELPVPQYTWLRILAGQSGVGGDDSWGAKVHEQYRLTADRSMELTFQISER